MRKVEFVCQQCGDDFHSKKADRNRQPKFCSRGCYALAMRKDKPCLVCGEHVNWNNKIYCSKKCATSVQKGKPFSEEHRKALSKAKKGKPVKPFSEEHRQALSKSLMGKPQPWNRGKNHHAYVDGGKGVSERQRDMSSLEYKIWRRTVYERDDYTCQHCGEKGGRLNADHILPYASYPEKRYDIDNGRTLCFECHKKTPTFGGRTKRRKVSCVG